MTASSHIRKNAALHERLARRAPAFQQSVWETVDRLVAGAGPDTIYFGNGTPSRELIPFDEMRIANQKAWDDIRETPGALDYGDAPGYPPLRDLIGRRMAHVGVMADRSNILLTNGSQQAIDYLCRLVLEPSATRSLADLDLARDATVTVAIGPEGGFSERDLAVLKAAGYTGVRVGPRILRTETAGPAVIAALNALFGDWQ